MRKILLFPWHIPRNVLIGCLLLYQKTLSPDHGWLKVFFPQGYCRYYPTCSHYGILALKKYGFMKGAGKTIWRIIRCNPISKGGEDYP